MAITRCPYCHAIIDENDKYCNNCGTQLLFADDEEIEEEIPGEKIVDAPVEEKDYTVDEPEEEKRLKTAKDLESEIDEELADEVREKTEEMALDELLAEEAGEDEGDEVTEEVILVDELEASKAAAGDGSQALGDEAVAGGKAPEPIAVNDKDEEEAAEVKDEDEEDEEEEDEGEEDEEEEEDEAAEEELADELEEEEEEEEEEDKRGSKAGYPSRRGAERRKPGSTPRPWKKSLR